MYQRNATDVLWKNCTKGMEKNSSEKEKFYDESQDANCYN